MFVIETPFWKTNSAKIFYVIFLALLIVYTFRIRTRTLRRLNQQYKEREIVTKKIEKQKEELSIKNKNITDSINYAQRIQLALMPSQKVFKTIFPESFILYMPKDIVSGDFYWVNEIDDRVFFAVVDCTGHGVPGAFMSIIGFELFRRITTIEKVKKPSNILNNLNEDFARIFKDVEDITVRDGMDLAFCTIDKKRKVLEFAGAFNSIYIIRDNKIMEIKGNRFSIGLSDADDDNMEFVNHEISLEDDDVIYLFSDGYADQFGGPEGKKFKYRRFRHLLLTVHQLPMERQYDFLKQSIMEWKGELEQVDDILIMGIWFKK
jgi:serine phosphatase RsbU (regulator of sigma subunit)